MSGHPAAEIRRGAAGRSNDRVAAASVRRHRAVALHLIDVRNLVGYPTPASDACLRVLDACLSVADCSPEDHVIVGLDVSLARRLVWHLPSGIAVRWARGPGGGRDALLAAVRDLEQLARSYERLVVASGDGRFTGVVAEAKARGLDVYVLARRTALSRALAKAGGHVHCLAVPQDRPILKRCAATAPLATHRRQDGDVCLPRGGVHVAA